MHNHFPAPLPLEPKFTFSLKSPANDVFLTHRKKVEEDSCSSSNVSPITNQGGCFDTFEQRDSFKEPMRPDVRPPLTLRTTFDVHSHPHYPLSASAQCSPSPSSLSFSPLRFSPSVSPLLSPASCPVPGVSVQERLSFAEPNMTWLKSRFFTGTPTPTPTSLLPTGPSISSSIPSPTSMTAAVNDVSSAEAPHFNSAAQQSSSSASNSDGSQNTSPLTHFQSFIMIKKFRCEQCNLSFPTARQLRVHQRKVHNCSHPFYCTECGSSFTQSSSLHRHMRLHNGNLTFPCHHCNRQFSSAEILQRHLRVHESDESERKFVCPFEDCKKRFVARNSLQVHMRTHTGEKPFVCHCGRSFSQNCHLNRHQATHKENES
eukprot:GILI01007239.1.p1 GENE.GILI01007239.1~~GILI01007239.1.p1  ORF type:complete len:373 (-),score=47.82 GILI01007239.1:470-1588(-)